MSIFRRWLDRIKAVAPQEIGSHIAWQAIGWAWVLIGGPPLITYLLGRWAETPWDVKFAMMFVTACAGALVWNAFFRAPVGISHRATLSTRRAINDADAKHEPAVEFWLPSKWEPGFRFRNLGLDEKTTEILAEEVSVRVVAKRRMQDVRFEISVRQRQQNQLETIARIGSDRFTGVVTPGLDQTFVIMRRTFSMVTAVRKSLKGDNSEIHEQTRADREIIFFPENPARFTGKIGHIYYVHIAVHHDDGVPDEARFALTLDEKRVPVITKLSHRDNIEPIITD